MSDLLNQLLRGADWLEMPPPPPRPPAEIRDKPPAKLMREAAAEIDRLRTALEPPSIRYAMEKAGIPVSDTELETICRKLGGHQQSPEQ